MVELLSVVEVVVQPTLPTLLVHYIHTYIGIELHGTKGGKHEVGSNGEKYAWASLHSYIPCNPKALALDTKSICMEREQPKNAVLFGWLF